MQNKNIEVTLEIDGKEQTFTNTKVKGVLLRKTTEVIHIFNTLDDGLDIVKMDAMVDYMVDVFGGKFTREQYYNGIALEDTVTTINEVATTIMEVASSKIKNS